MADDKQYSPRDAAFAVLQKVGEVLAKSELAKKYEGFKAVEESARESGASNPAAVAAAAGRKKYGKHAFQEAAAHSKKMGKKENPDEKEDAELGEKVEHEVEQHMQDNKEAERKEGHKILKCEHCGAMHKSEQDVDLCKDFSSVKEGLEELSKSEKSKHDRCVEDVKENSPEVKNPHAVCVAEGVKPAKWSKSEYAPSMPKKLDYKPSKEGENEEQPEKSDKAFEVEGQKAQSGDPRLAQQKSPESNPKEAIEGNNEAAGSTPKDGIEQQNATKGHLKLAKFIGRMEHKRSLKKTMF